MRKIIYSWLLKNYLCALTSDLVIGEEKTLNGSTRLLLGGKPVDAGMAKILKEEAFALGHMEIWKIMQATINNEAHRKICLQARGWEDSFAGKTMLYNLDLIEKIRQGLEKIIIVENK